MRETILEKPLIAAIEIVDVPEEPDASVKLDGLAEIEKSGTPAPETVTVIFAERMSLPLK